MYEIGILGERRWFWRNQIGILLFALVLLIYFENIILVVWSTLSNGYLFKIAYLDIRRLSYVLLELPDLFTARKWWCMSLIFLCHGSKFVSALGGFESALSSKDHYSTWKSWKSPGKFVWMLSALVDAMNALTSLVVKLAPRALNLISYIFNYSSSDFFLDCILYCL